MLCCLQNCDGKDSDKVNSQSHTDYRNLNPNEKDERMKALHSQNRDR